MKKVTLRNLPEFALGATMYQIFLRQFTPQGTLKAAEQMIPHLAELGIKIAYLCPMFDADDDKDQKFWSPRQIASGMNNPKNPYRMNDYYKIDPEYGTDEDLASFIQTAHRFDLKIMLDLVYLHCGPRATLLSMDPEMIKRDKKGKPELGPWKFPLLNFESRKLRDYLIDNMLYFVKKFDVDGYRCDVGGGIPLDFWEEARKKIDRVKKDFFMLNEDSGKVEHQKIAFDFDYGFRVFEILDALSGKITPGFLKDKWKKANIQFRVMNYTDNHDVASDDYENRHEKVLSPELNDMSLAFIFSLPGMPLIYNGQEIADANRHSLWANHEYGHHLGIDWSKAVTPRGRERFALLQELIDLRRSEDILIEGSCRYLDTDREDAVFAFERELDGHKITCVFNFRDEPLKVNLINGKIEAGPEMLLADSARIREDGTIDMLPYGFILAKN